MRLYFPCSSIHQPHTFRKQEISLSLRAAELWKVQPRIHKFQRTLKSHFTFCNTHVTIATPNFSVLSVTFLQVLRTYASVSPCRACCIVPWSFGLSGGLPAASGVRLHSWCAQYWTNEVYRSPYKDQKGGAPCNIHCACYVPWWSERYK